MRGENPSVFVVDDDSSIRSGVVRLLQTRGYRTADFASAEEFLDAEPEPQIACLLLDVCLPGMNGFELQERLPECGMFFPIVFVTGYGDIPMAVRAIKSGAVGFLTKPIQERQLIDGIEQALAVCRKEFESRSEMAALKQLYGTLTAREAQVLAFVTSGKLNKQTAAELGIVENTVKVHRRRIMRKMRAGSLAELVSMAQKLKIL